MVRIAYICTDPGVPVFGSKGCSVHVQEVLRTLRKRGAGVTLFAQSPGNAPPPDLSDLPVHRLSPLPDESPWHRERGALANNQSLYDRLNCEGPFDMVYERYALWSHAGMTFAREAGIPGILEVNAPLIEEQRTYRTLIHIEQALDTTKRAFASASALVAVSQQVARYIVAFAGTEDRIQVIPNGVDTGRFSPDRPASCPGRRDTFTVGFVGSLKPWHGLDGLVEAFAILHARAPESRLLIVGDGPERPSLETGLAARGLREVTHLTGLVPHEEVPAMIASMDAGVAPYPSLDNCYFSPLKVFEYMAAGLPVVASRIGQLENLLIDGYNGLLYSPDDTAALAGLLIQLARDAPLRKRLGTAARDTILAAHTWESVGARILELAGLHSVASY